MSVRHALGGGRRLGWLFAWASWIIVLAATAQAGSGNKVTLPVSGKTAYGLSLSLETEWVESRAYRPVVLNVNCNRTLSKSPRVLTVDLSIGNWGAPNKATVTFDVEIPAGTTKVTHHVTVPQLTLAQTVTMDVWEDGRHLDELSIENLGIMTGGIGVWDMELPGILFVSNATVDISRFGFLSTQNYSNQTTAFVNCSQIATFAERAAGDLPETWLDYSGLDVIVLSLAEAEGLAANRPKVWRSIRQWTLAGGNLCLYGASGETELARIEELLHCAPIAVTAANAETPHPGWARPAPELYDRLILSGVGGFLPNPQPATPSDDSDIEFDMMRSAPAEAGFVLRPARLGTVVAIADANPFPGKMETWQWIFNAIGPQKWKWRFRHGISSDAGNPDFDNFVISDVGLPPLRTYRVLISLFVLGIGPLNYWLLRSRQRLHLLLFTVPAAAVLVTGGLIIFALLGDGLQTRLRARSYTRLDPAHDEAVSWSRLSYYTGLAPSEGLLFPADTAVLPLTKSALGQTFAGRRRYLAWTPEQHLTRGWLGSRTPTQYITVRAYDSQRELAVAPQPDGKLAVQNQLGAAIQYLVVTDAAGKPHGGRALADSARGTLAPLVDDVESQAFLNEVHQAFVESAPRFPADYDDDAASSGFFLSSRRRRTAWNQQNDLQTTSGSVLEEELRRVQSEIAERKLAPRSFVAVVARPAEVPVGLNGAVESQSLHVIEGTW